jgi:hypothetical protein
MAFSATDLKQPIHSPTYGKTQCSLGSTQRGAGKTNLDTKPEPKLLKCGDVVRGLVMRVNHGGAKVWMALYYVNLSCARRFELSAVGTKKRALGSNKTTDEG